MIDPLTRQVTIRAVCEADAEVLTDLIRRNQNYLRPWQPLEPSMLDPDLTRESLRNKANRTERGEAFDGVIAVDGQVVGSMSAHHLQRQYLATGWVGYWVDAEVAGRGIASAALAQLVVYCRDVLRLHRLEAFCQVANPGSQKVLENNGFSRAGHLPQHLYLNDRWADEYLYYLLLRGPQTPPYLGAARHLPG